MLLPSIRTKIRSRATKRSYFCLAKRTIRKALTAANVAWPEWYALRRFLGTQVRMRADIDTASKALGNSKEVANKHYIKPTEVLPDVRKAVNSAVSGLIRGEK